MSVEFEGMTVQGFMPFKRGPYHIPLRRQGLVFIVGENRLSKMADSNGAGKTSIPDAFSWVHYDKIQRGITGLDVIHYDAEFACVESFFAIGKTKYVAVREQSRKKGDRARLWELFTLTATKREPVGSGSQIEGLFRLSFMAFTNTLLFGTSAMERFTQLSDVPQKKIFDDLIEVAFFGDKRKEVDIEYKELTQQYRDVMARYETMKAGLTTQKTEREQLQDVLTSQGQRAAEEWFIEHQIHLDTMQEIDGLYRLYEQLRDFETWAQDYTQQRRDLEGVLIKLQRQLRWLRERNQKYLNTRGPDICPTCLRPNDVASRRQIEATFRPFLEWQQRLERYEDDLNVILDGTDLKLETDFKDVSHELQGKLRRLKVPDERTTRETEFKGVVEALEARIETATREVEKLRQEALQLDSELKLREFWLEGFGHKGIKALLLRDYEGFIRDRLARYSTLLTNGELTLLFSAQRQLKSGETRDELLVEAKNSFGGDHYDALSSGEKQRVDLCYVLALQDLVREVHQSHFGLALYDEIFEHFDETGCEAVMDFLTEQRRDVGSQFVISQNPKLLGYPSDHVLRVVKTKTGSEIIYA